MGDQACSSNNQVLAINESEGCNSILFPESGHQLARADCGTSSSGSEGQTELLAIGIEQRLPDEIVVTGLMVSKHGKRMKIVGALLEKDREAYGLPPRDDEK